mmetsp:Transcript_5887/g.18107  ORF Transcript_5887/g.18107 Transcript_5887/m.18107 type:complete len:236 (-) Transcript_5887:1354-2061(-)
MAPAATSAKLSSKRHCRMTAPAFWMRNAPPRYPAALFLVKFEAEMLIWNSSDDVMGCAQLNAPTLSLPRLRSNTHSEMDVLDCSTKSAPAANASFSTKRTRSSITGARWSSLTYSAPPVLEPSVAACFDTLLRSNVVSDSRGAHTPRYMTAPPKLLAVFSAKFTPVMLDATASSSKDSSVSAVRYSAPANEPAMKASLRENVTLGPIVCPTFRMYMPPTRWHELSWKSVLVTAAV